MAAATGGRFFLAKDARAIESIYREIDRLERSEIESVRHVDYREVFPVLLALSMALLLLETLLRCTVFRRLP